MLFYSECVYALIFKINMQSFPSIVRVLKLCVCVSKDRNSIKDIRFTNIKRRTHIQAICQEVFPRVPNKRMRRGKQDREDEEAIQGYDSM